MITPTHAPQRRRTDSPRVYDPALAIFVNEKLIENVWRQELDCPSSRANVRPHRLTCDPDGGRATCTCPGYATHGHCCHATGAAAILRVTAYNAFAALTGAELRDLDWATRGQYGQCGIAGNIRYDILGDCLAADLRRQDAPTAIAAGKRAVCELYGESA